MKIPRFLALSLAVAGLCSWLAGCASGPQPSAYNVKFELGPSLAGSSIQVDVVGVNSLDLPKWESLSVTDYWKPDNAQRREAEKFVVQFGAGKPEVQTFSSADPIWQRWLATGAAHLVILVDLPGVAADRQGNADSRRTIVPLDARKWGSDVKTLEFRVQESGLRPLTAIKSV